MITDTLRETLTVALPDRTFGSIFCEQPHRTMLRDNKVTVLPIVTVERKHLLVCAILVKMTLGEVLMTTSFFRTQLASMLSCVALLTGCGTTVLAVSPADGGLDYPRGMPAVDSLDWSVRGTVVAISNSPGFAMSELPAGSTAKTMVYRSISGITGTQTLVSGAVFAPPGPPPPGGWPVIGYAHGTVGITEGCGPTQDPRLFGDISAVSTQLRQGYAVAFTDYAGLGRIDPALGETAVHAYLEPKSAAFNLIDAVRAARTVMPDLSPRWVALGASQGGETAWAAAEYFDEYGEGTDLLGSAALVPALNMSGLVDGAESSSLTTDQLYLYPLVVNGLAAVDHSIRPDDYLHDGIRDNQNILLSCRPPESAQKPGLVGQLKAANTAPATPAAAAALGDLLSAYALPHQSTLVPILVVYGGIDETVLPQWTEVAMGRACQLGDTVMRVRLDDQGHTLDPGALLGTWVADRFAGIPADGNC